jgi:hypothetical protein
MIPVRVGDGDVADLFPPERRKEGVDLPVPSHAGVDDRNPALPEDIDTGAGGGERPGIVRDPAADQRRDLLQAAGFRALPVKRDFVCHHNAMRPAGAAAQATARPRS